MIPQFAQTVVKIPHHGGGQAGGHQIYLRVCDQSIHRSAVGLPCHHVIQLIHALFFRFNDLDVAGLNPLQIFQPFHCIGRRGNVLLLQLFLKVTVSGAFQCIAESGNAALADPGTLG